MRKRPRTARTCAAALAACMLALAVFAQPDLSYPFDVDAAVRRARLSDPDGDVLVFVLDSEIDERFLDGRVAGLHEYQVSHGSIVARVVRRYCRVPIVGVPTGSVREHVNRDRYLAGLRAVRDYARRRPELRIVVNISLGSVRADDEERTLIGEIVAAGALPVAAAGNEGSEAPVFPGAYDGVIAVAATGRSGRAPASSYGEHVAISASGDITFIDYEFLPPEHLRREMELHGTSFAAPRVAATVAYVLQNRPGMSPREAFGILERTVRPIDDPLFEDGLLGCGALDIYRAKLHAEPMYGLLQVGLPSAFGLALLAASVYLVVRHRLPGLFMALLLWLVVAPAAIVLAMRAVEAVEFVGAGDPWTGLAGGAILFVAAAAAMRILHGNVARLTVPVALGAVVVTVLIGLRLAGTLPTCVLAALLGLKCAEWLERGTRQYLADLKASGPGLPAEELARLRVVSFEERVRALALESLLARTDEQLADDLEHLRAYAGVRAEIREELRRRAASAPG